MEGGCAAAADGYQRLLKVSLCPSRLDCLEVVFWAELFGAFRTDWARRVVDDVPRVPKESQLANVRWQEWVVSSMWSYVEIDTFSTNSFYLPTLHLNFWL